MSITTIPSPSFLAADEPLGVVHVQTDCTIAEAAKILDMPEDCIDELIKIGVLKSRQYGDQCLVQRDRLLEYHQGRESRRAALDEMVRMNQEMGLYDD